MIKVDNLKIFEPTPYFRKMMILEFINENRMITQKQLSLKVGIVPSLINKYVAELQNEGLIRIVKEGKRANYFLTDEGLSELNLMKLVFFNDIVSLTNKINSQLENIFLKLRGKTNIAIYGAGEVGKALGKLLTNRGFNVVAFFDDDKKKLNSRIEGIPVISLGTPARFDALVVASFKNSKKMAEKALKFGYRDVYIFKTEDLKLIWFG
ncbi:MAG: winged helix-turn-helix transcriptional regulator [Thermosipho sp. (in: Bacteria)]|nr:winged helix-turn-helix transcriptional regulator [Thermosipho sp. (in: thermotogales)]